MLSDKEVIDVMKFFLEDQLTDKPKRVKLVGASKKEYDTDLGYVFTASDLGWLFPDRKGPSDHKSCRTYSTLKNRVSNLNESYWTPNTFYHHKYRDKDSLRWINAIAIDIDNEDLSVNDVLAMVERVGLPMPTLINRTPSGGCHIYWKVIRTRAFHNVLLKYEAIARTICRFLDADPQAITAERYFRIPRNIMHLSKVTYDFELFSIWLTNQEVEEQEKRSSVTTVLTTGILNHPAIKKLLRGVSEGIRDMTAFTLGLVYKVSSFTSDQTLDALVEWNHKNSPPLPYNVLRAKVKSAYKAKYRGPKASIITQLSGIPFHYQVIRNQEQKERKRNDYVRLSTVKNRIMLVIRRAGGQIRLSQSKLAKTIGVPLRSLQKAIYELQNSSKILVMTTGSGSNTITAYKVCRNSGRYSPSNTKQESTYPQVATNGGNLQAEYITQNLIHLDRVVGGYPPLDPGIHKQE